MITDASHCPKTKAAGYGYWAISKRGKRGGGGPLKNKIDSSNAAEVAALVNGLFIACESRIAVEGDHVLLQTDCQAAILALEGMRSNLTKDEKLAKHRFFLIKREYKVRISFRHVKGHTQRQEARYVTNSMCDSRARAGMKLARKIIEGKRHEKETFI